MLATTWEKGLTHYLARMWQVRYFLFSLVAMDLRNRYRRSFLGIGWSLVRPLSMTVVFCVVFCSIFNISAAEYAPYVLVGLTVWQFIVEATMLGCTSFHQGGPYIRQQPVPLGIFPLRIVLGTGFHALIALGLATLLTWFLRGRLEVVALLSLLPTLLLVFMLCWSLAIIGGLFTTHFHDTQHILEILFQTLFYLTPIMYPLENVRQRTRFAWVLNLNPFTHVLQAVRDPILHGRIPTLEEYAALAGVVGVMCLAGLLCLRKLERNLVFWL